MKRLAVTPGTCLASGLSSAAWEQQAQQIDLEDTPLASGAQGEITSVVSLDGQRAPGLLVKRFIHGFPPSLPAMVQTVRQHHAQYRLADRVALRALPLFLLQGTLQGEPVHGYVMRRVTGQQWSELCSDVQALNRYINLPWPQRLELCRQFVEGMDVLYSLCIIHADLNGQNLMVDMARTTLTIIDLDGGAVAGTGLTPVTIGKLEPGWLAPEIMRQLAQTTQRQAIEVGITVDLWSIACGVHQLLFGLPPFFFMAKQEEIPTYLARHTWPDVQGLRGVQVHNQGVFGYYQRAYAACPPDVKRLLALTFQRGYLDPTQRATAYQLLQALPADYQPPPPSPPLPAPLAPPPPPPAPARVICPRCGAENPQVQLYCQDCATPLGRERLCPHSFIFPLPLPGLARFGRHWMPEQARFCPVCGRQARAVW